MSTSPSFAKKANSKVTALARMLKKMVKGFYRISVLIFSFNMDVLLKKMNRKINRIQVRALRLVSDDYLCTFNEQLGKDNYVCIQHRNMRRVAIEMLKVKHKLCTEILKSLFCRRGKTIRASFSRPHVNPV